MSALCHSKIVITSLSIRECPSFHLSFAHVRGNPDQTVKLLQSNTTKYDCGLSLFLQFYLRINRLKPCLVLSFVVKVFNNTSNENVSLCIVVRCTKLHAENRSYGGSFIFQIFLVRTCCYTRPLILFFFFFAFAT